METKHRFSKAVSLSKESDIIFAQNVPLTVFKDKRGSYLGNVHDFLAQRGVGAERRKTIPPTLSTAAEVNGVIIFLETHPEYEKICFVSSWYHVPRIMFMWLCRGKLAHPIPVWVDEGNLLIRIIAEFPKLFLAITPASFQDWLVERMFKKMGANI